MGIGYLIINVYADNIGQPVEGATVILIGEKVNMKLETDSNGKTIKVELACPDKKYSLNYQKEVRPYATYNIKVTKSGLETVIIEGIEILDGTTAIQDVYMQSDPLGDAPDKYINIPDHALWGDYPPKVVVDPMTVYPIDSAGNVPTMPVIPEFVVVHDGLPTNASAANYYIPFADYIKNVASGGIYATWPLETLKANIYAILSFVGSRIHSKWYRSKGYVFTITSSTQFDQKFIYGRNIYEEISDVVDNIFDKFIRRNNQSFPFLAQYNDGEKTNNPGWLSQWGSKDLGDKGYKAIQIIKYYYGDNFSLDTAKVIEGLSASFPGYNLTVGIFGDAVQKMQLQLNVIRSAYPHIPVIDPPDGKFGPRTKEAVLKFQNVFGMPETGVVDFPTWYRISYLYVAISKMLQGRYEF